MNRVILITGASRGIGASTAFKFASDKDTVIINYHTKKEKAYEVQRQIKEKYHLDSSVMQADISNKEEVIKMVDEILAKYGRIDVLINNAAIALDDEFQNHTADNFQKILKVNLLGTFFLSQYVSRFMQKEKKGIIINVASNNGIDCYQPISLDYDASKAGVIALTRRLASELKPYIRVNAVAPGWTKTDSVMEMYPPFQEEEKKKIMLQRFAEPEEIANVIFFLASPEENLINGEVIRVDGGII